MPFRFYPCAFSLLLLIAQALGAEAWPENLASLSESRRTELAEQWREQPSLYERRELVRQVLSPALATRCAALDLLESLSGHDFGIDPWMPPSDVSASARQALDDWAGSDAPFLNTAAEPTEDRMREAAALLASSDDETRERTIRLFLPHAKQLIAVIERTLAAGSNLGDRETRHLRYAEYRLQLEEALRGKAGTVARQLVSTRRGEIIEGLEALRKAPPSILPVAFSLFEHPDPLVRETAVDVMLTCSPAAALPVLLPLLEKEEDPNILQIAFRRSVDTPLPALKQLLIRHTGSDNEDLAVAALNTLRDLKRETVSPSDKENGGVKLSGERIAALLVSPYWRIRAACLELLASSDSSRGVLPPVEDDLRDHIYKALKDSDPTVRRQAFAAIVQGQYFDPSLASHCKEFVADDPDMLAQALYLLMATNADIDDSFRRMIERMTAEQLEQIVAMEEEFSDYLSDNGRGNRATRAVLAAIEKNPDAAVQTLYLKIRAKRLVATTTGWKRLLTFFTNPAVSQAHKAELLRKLPSDKLLERIDSSLLPVSPAERERNKGKGKIRRTATTRKFAPSLEAFLSLLRGWRDGKEDTGDELADAALICLASFGEAHSAELLQQRYASLALPEKLRLFEKARTSFLPKEIFLSGLRDESEKVRDEAMSSLLCRHDIGLTAEVISPATATDEVWVDQILASWVRNCLYSSDKEERSQLRPLLLAAIAEPAVPADRRDMTAFYCCLDETTRKKAPVQDYIAQCHSPAAEYLHFINEAPKHPDDVLAWAERWKSSRLPLIRRSVASCLQNVNQWYYYFPREDAKISKVRATILYRKIMADYTAARKIPGRILEIVRELERDPDPGVSTHASLSLLYATGSCNTASLLDHLARLNAAMKRENDEEQDDLSGERVLAYTLQRQLQDCVSKMAEEPESFGVVFDSQKPGNGTKLTSDEKAVVMRVMNLFGGEIEPAPEVLDQLSGQEGGPIVRFADLAVRGSSSPDINPETPKTASKKNPQADEATSAATLVFFEKPGCDECARVARELARLQKEYPDLQVETCTITSPEGLEKNAVLCRRLDVPSRDRSLAPAVFSSRGYLARKRLDEPALRRLAAEEVMYAYKRAESPASPETTPDETARARRDIAEAYAGMTLGVVLLGGLIDGVNPCAFATLVFFLSYLRLARRSRRETLLTGTVFIAAVYLTYFAIGLLFHELIGVLRTLHTWKTALDLLFAALAALAAMLSFRDALLARRGRQQEMSLKLPAFLQNRIRAVTRRQVRARSIVLSACVSGILISALELACTGQVYAPIIYQIQLGSSSAVGLLALYNLAFIAPLIVIFWIGSRDGGSSLAAFQQRHAALVKSLLGFLFLALAALIASQVWS